MPSIVTAVAAATMPVLVAILVMAVVMAIVMPPAPMRVTAPVGAAHPPMVAATFPARLVIHVAGA